MEIGPIWRALLRNKTTFVLTALQIAVTMAIMVNAVSIVQERSRLKARASGIDEQNIFYLTSTPFAPDFDIRSSVTEDLDMLRRLPGVVSAIATNNVPLMDRGWSMSIQTTPGDAVEGTGIGIYFVDEHGIDTFGVNLTAGRNFRHAEAEWQEGSSHRWPPVGIISQATAETLWPKEAQDAVGKVVYIANDQPLTIVGVIERLQAAWTSWSGIERTMLVPLYREDEVMYYVIRAETGYLDKLMPQIEQMLADGNDGRVIRNVTTMQETRERSYLEDTALIKLLVFIASLLTTITGMGIVGLASFSVSTRTWQIGTRRALGASRGAILRYFMLENFMVSSVGVVAGAVLAVAMNIWMVQAFDLTPLAWYMIPLTMLLLWLVGQVAVYGPARKASLVPPAVATRSL